MTSTHPSSQTTTNRISDEVFAEVEREVAAQSLALPVSEPDKLDQLAGTVLPYVWATAAGVWVTGMMILQTLIPTPQCIGLGLVVIGVLSSIVFAWRTRETARA